MDREDGFNRSRGSEGRGGFRGRGINDDSPGVDVEILTIAILAEDFEEDSGAETVKVIVVEKTSTRGIETPGMIVVVPSVVDSIVGFLVEDSEIVLTGIVVLLEIVGRETIHFVDVAMAKGDAGDSAEVSEVNLVAFVLVEEVEISAAKVFREIGTKGLLIADPYMGGDRRSEWVDRSRDDRRSSWGDAEAKGGPSVRSYGASGDSYRRDPPSSGYGERSSRGYGTSAPGDAPGSRYESSYGDVHDRKSQEVKPLLSLPASSSYGYRSSPVDSALPSSDVGFPVRPAHDGYRQKY
ncbi:unnamed protein product [Notodromas monacha]|uniref:Uncharacterized protein n=1 Tax=Notodromas monacha TaxID=399045 RepID=A0A7R9BSW3_9CRUS|nr:unnamed protein product [Notodromas monacha]CAG0921125.1 unnamed protein product [Notodromas monacha]